MNGDSTHIRREMVTGDIYRVACPYCTQHVAYTEPYMNCLIQCRACRNVFELPMGSREYLPAPVTIEWVALPWPKPEWM